MTSEFSRPERVDTIGDQPRMIAVEAGADERAALAHRFGLVAIGRLAATWTVRREAAGIDAVGRVEGTVTQRCAVTGEPLSAKIDEAVTLLFADDVESGEDYELSGRAVDTLPIENGTIDLGEATAETLALALDPFPRGPGAEAALRDAGVLGEDQAGPFGALAALKDRMARREP